MKGLWGIAAACCFWSPALLACSCDIPVLERWVTRADNVFSALITGGEVTTSADVRTPSRRLTFRVTERFKGDIPFSALSNSGSSSNCGMSFQVGAEYLVFVADNGRVGSCSGTRMLSGPRGQESAPYLEILRLHRDDGYPLADPWHYRAGEGRCDLHAWVPHVSGRAFSRLHINYHRRPGYEGRASLSLDLWNFRLDHAGYSLGLAAGSERWSAPWMANPANVGTGSPGRYVLSGRQVLDLVSALRDPLVERFELDFRGPEPIAFDTALRTAHARGAMDRFQACVEGVAGVSARP